MTEIHRRASPARERLGRLLLIAVSFLVVRTLLAPLAVLGAEAPPVVLMAPGRGEVRALIVGIDHYLHVNPLHGAVADARDIAASMRAMGSQDVTVLIDAAADRASLISELNRLEARTHKGDLVIITLAGHGSKEDERVKGSSKDGADEVFLLNGFDAKTGPGGAEKILNHEFHHYIKLIEDLGAQVIFVADTCYGGGLAREIAPGSAETSYRQVPRYRLVEDDLKPVSSPEDALLTSVDFRHTTFLAAVDSETKAPEILIDKAYRGALSYAFARAVEGAADEKRDGKITMRELFGYTRKIVYQLSDERQNIVTEESPSQDLDHEVVLELGSRGVPRLEPTVSTPIVIQPRESPLKPVRLASLTDHKSVFAGLLQLHAPFDIVDSDAAPDLIWDPVAHEAIAGGDKVALDVDVDDLSGVIDRTAGVRDLKALVVKAPQALRVLPDASLHRKGTRIEVEVGDLAGRSLVMADITGSGIVQMLYPMKPTETAPSEGDFRIPFVVRDPYGADQVVAITSMHQMDGLVAALRTIDKHKSAAEVAELIRRFGPPDARIGLVGLFTVP